MRRVAGGRSVGSEAGEAAERGHPTASLSCCTAHAVLLVHRCGNTTSILAHAGGANVDIETGKARRGRAVKILVAGCSGVSFLVVTMPRVKPMPENKQKTPQVSNLEPPRVLQRQRLVLVHAQHPVRHVVQLAVLLRHSV